MNFDLFKPSDLLNIGTSIRVKRIKEKGQFS